MPAYYPDASLLTAPSWSLSWRAENWIELSISTSAFFVADWHADNALRGPGYHSGQCLEMVIDWLAVGINPGEAKLFIQSQVPAHAGAASVALHDYPLGWLERVPSYKDQQEKLKGRDLATYGFLGYPLLQAADILIYKAGLVPVGGPGCPCRIDARGGAPLQSYLRTRTRV